MRGDRTIRILNGCGVWIENSVMRVMCLVSLSSGVMPNSYPG